MQNLYYDIQREIEQRNLLRPLDVLLVGATGVGKSSTINALFGDNVAKVGTGCEPETQIVSHYEVNDYFRIHDSAGLGDGKENDKRHARNITDILIKTVSVGGDNSIPYGLIDMVMVILDGSSRDLGTAYQLLRDVIVPIIDPKRIIVLINQADMAMKGRYWDSVNNCPEATLKQFLDEQAYNVQQRIKEATGLNIHMPIYYSAEHGYNIDKILLHIKQNLPTQRRVIQIDSNSRKFIF
ncbi:GTPase family protein [Moraxella sp. ZY210820]|uniref:GTPase family protein n=1 Tax=unclassified Moraxella TaxID=2685852 RepID=UPI002731E5FD|nr:GTPase [Moraxella sp. ZY210820]WLF83910.1 50S ribosome-binding GTPase [Moraxella sp. ZY210820]